MKARLVTMGTLGITFVILLGFGTSAHAVGTTDFALFDNSNPLTPSEGVQCSARKPFAYAATVSDLTGAPIANVLRVTYADGDLTRFRIAADATLQISGFARGGNITVNNADRCITICAETAGKLAGQMSVQTDSASHPETKCRNITCGPGGEAPACPAPF